MTFTWGELDGMRPKGEWHSPLPPTCKKCSYVLTGLTEDRCPECGTPFKWDEVRKRAAWTWTLTVRLQHANKDAITGVIMALSGWFAMGFVRLIGWWDSLGIIVDIINFMMSGMCVILGSQVLNIRRVPRWARRYAGDPPPSIMLGVLSILLGLGLLAGVILL